jgi:hypothetical protein
MRSRSVRSKGKNDVKYNTQKITFKIVQMPIAIVLNFVAFYFVKGYFLSELMWMRILQVFIVVFASVMVSNIVGLIVIIVKYSNVSAIKILSRDRSYTKFFLMAITYSFMTSLTFSLGIFWLIYYHFGNDLLTLMVMYIVMYVIIELFSYGLITWLFRSFSIGYDKKVIVK